MDLRIFHSVGASYYALAVSVEFSHTNKSMVNL